MPMSEKVELKNDAVAGTGSRRRFLKDSAQTLGAAALMALVPPGVRQAAWAAGSDAPEKKEVKIGFIPLTDLSLIHI